MTKYTYTKFLINFNVQLDHWLINSIVSAHKHDTRAKEIATRDRMVRWTEKERERGDRRGEEAKWYDFKFDKFLFDWELSRVERMWRTV